MTLPRSSVAAKTRNILTRVNKLGIKSHRCYATIVYTAWLYCVECIQYSIWLEALGYLCISCLLPAFDEA